jgi:hypothetical protein
MPARSTEGVEAGAGETAVVGADELEPPSVVAPAVEMDGYAATASAAIAAE